MLKVGVLVSGGGTNLQAILDAIDCGKITNAEVSLVISNNPKAYALERAKNHNIEAVCISPKQFENREEFHRALLAKLKESGVELIVLAGFLVAIPPMIVEAYPNKIINIHHFHFVIGNKIDSFRKNLPLRFLHNTSLKNFRGIIRFNLYGLLKNDRTCICTCVNKMYGRTCHTYASFCGVGY